MTESTPSRIGETAAHFFGARIPEYDDLIRRAVPGYDALTAALVAELPSDAARVLELGCGTGNLSVRLAERLPEATITFVDASAEMLAVTEARLRTVAPALAARASFREAHFEALDVPDARFDLVASAIALHHVADKAPVYHRIHEQLRPGGRCCIADQLRMSHDAAQAVHWEAFLDFWRQPGHVNEAEFRELLAHSEAHDHYETLERQFRLLQEAGFHEVDAPWRMGLWGVVTATA